jgi:hypothetical protein
MPGPAGHRRRRGRRDGRAGVPALEESASSDYEKQLLSRGGQHMAQVIRGYDPKSRETEAKREAAIERFRLLTDWFVEEMRRYDAKRKLLGRDVIVHFVSRGWYRIIMFVIALGEFALNAQAFEVFQKPLILRVLVAATIGVGIPWVAHGCGIWVRQWPKPAWKTGVLLADFAHEEEQELDTLHQRVSRLDRKLDALDAEIHRLNGEADRLQGSESAELEEVKAIVKELVSMYRGENVLARKDGQKPKAFDTEPALVEPSVAADRPAGTPKSEVDKIRQRRLRAKADMAEARAARRALTPGG